MKEIRCHNKNKVSYHTEIFLQAESSVLRIKLSVINLTIE
jgi:hypothetical protein